MLSLAGSEDGDVFMEPKDVVDLDRAVDDATVKRFFLKLRVVAKFGKRAFPLLLSAVRLGQRAPRHLQASVGLLLAKPFD